MSLDAGTAKVYLIDLLQRAYSGELAAAYAYRGHANSVRDPLEKKEIKQIEEDEWQHRGRLLEMLRDLGGSPRPHLEAVFAAIGRTIAFLCHVGGWFIPMYGAGKLERGNLVEYEMAARFAEIAGLPDFAGELLEFAEKEWEHEQYYRRKVESHALRKIFKVWPAPPEKEKIRESYRHFLATRDFSRMATAVFTVNRVSRYKLG